MAADVRTRRPAPGVVLLTAMLVLALGCAGAGTRSSGTAAFPPIPEGEARLTVFITGLETETGSLVVALFGSAASFESGSDPARSAVLPVSGSSISWDISALPSGTYAIKVFHDLDGDGQLARGAMGIPKEPYGISNDARGRLGPPSFDNASFAVSPGSVEIEIQVR